jgi:hypothetical protein
MVAATYTSDLTDIYMFESTTGVGAYGGGASGLGASPDYAIEGTNAVDKQIDNAEKGFLYDAVTAFSIGPNDHFFIWANLAVYGLANTRDLRGIVVNIGDSTTAFVKFHVAGSDTLPKGGIAPYAIRFVNTTLTNRRTLVGSPGTTPSQIGVGANVTGTAKFSNLAADAARIGTGYDILNGTGADAEANFAGIASDDEGTAEGIFQTASGGFAVQGKLRIGNSGTECELLDSNTNLFLVNTLDGHALTDFTEFIVADDLSIWTLTNVNFIALGTNNPGRLEMVTPLITAQDETSYDNSPTTEGTFGAGTGYAISDVVTLDDDWTTVTIDAVGGGGIVTQFTVNSTKGRSAVAGTTMTQSSTTGSGVGFTLTPDTDNILGGGTLAFTNVGFIDFGVTVLQSGATMSGCRWIGSDIITANGADLSGSSVSGFEGAANTSPLIWDVNTNPVSDLDAMNFEKGTAATHAIEFGLNSPTTMTLNDCVFTGYHTTLNNQNDSTFHIKRTSGTVTINITGNGTAASNLTYRSDGATVVIQQNVNVTFDEMKDNTEVRVYNNSTGAEITGIENATAGSPDNRNFVATVGAGIVVDYVIHNINYEYIRVEAFTWPTTNQTIIINQRLDRNFENP